MVQGSFVDPKAKIYTPALWKSLKSNLIEAVSGSRLCFILCCVLTMCVALWAVSIGDL